MIAGRSSIGVKLTALIASLALVLILGMTAWNTRSQVRSAEQSLEHKTFAYARLGARELEQAVAFDDTITAREVFEALALDPDVRTLILYGTRGNVLASAGNGRLEEKPRSAPEKAEVTRTASSVRIVAPVLPREGGAGTIVVELSATSVDRARVETIRGSASLAAAALVVCLVGAWLIGRSLRQRLSALATVARAVASGDVSCPAVKDTSHDEVGQLARGFEIMLARLNRMMADAALQAAEEQHRLDELVKLRTAELAERSQGVRFLLDHLKQGVAMVDHEGRLGEEHSRTLATWFGAPTPGQTLWGYLGESGVADKLELGWSAIVDDVLPLELAVDQLPSRFAIGGKELRMHVEPVERQGGKPRSFVVFFDDVTAEVERSRADVAQRDLAAVFFGLARERGSFATQMRELDELVARVVEHGDGSSGYRRDLHTLKGNSAMLGFERLAAICHDLEASVEEGGHAHRQALDTLGEVWRTLRAPMDTLRATEERTIDVAREELAVIERAVIVGEPRTTTVERLRALAFEPAVRRLGRLADWARAASVRQGKAEVIMDIDGGGLRFDPSTWESFWNAYVHVVRNALSHGIESPDERVASGKLARGRLQVSCCATAEKVVVETVDDGRGIDWGRIRERAGRLGIPTATSQDLVRALFHEGFSTQITTDELSGRGEGLAALRAATEDLGGAIAVDSVLGRRTSFSISFPLAIVGHAIAGESLLPAPPERRTA